MGIEWGSGGRRFESSRPDQSSQWLTSAYCQTAWEFPKNWFHIGSKKHAVEAPFE